MRSRSEIPSFSSHVELPGSSKLPSPLKALFATRGKTQVPLCPSKLGTKWQVHAMPVHAAGRKVPWEGEELGRAVIASCAATADSPGGVTAAVRRSEAPCALGTSGPGHCVWSHRSLFASSASCHGHCSPRVLRVRVV